VTKLAAILLLLLSSPLFGKDLYMVRTQQPFPEAMAALQEKIADKGYQLSRVQRVDIGLTASGYETDKYRVVFFGKLDEIRDISERHASLAPYLPLKIAIFAEGDDTILLASSFSHLRPFYPDKDLQADFDRWEKDIDEILEQVRMAE
jgi:uncharacterized protein (DUF302 family)